MSITLITGAARGIGFSMSKLAKARGDHVIAVCRQPSGALKNLGVEIIDGVELGSAEGVARVCAALSGRTIDCAILNAGVLDREILGNVGSKTDGIRRQFEINALAPLVLAEALLPALKDGSKLALITSRMGSVEDNTSGGYYGYRMSKAAMNMAGKTLALDLKNRGISVFLLHPGFVRTDMTQGSGDINADESAELLLGSIDRLTHTDTGTFWHANGQRLPW